ncbi:hypothetical protein ACFX11_013456 [Malus domestica]
MVHGLPSIQENEEICEGCALGKHHRDSFPHGKAWRAKVPLELIHTDVCGPMNTSTQVGNKYFLVFVDDYSRMTWVYFLRQKSEVFSIFKKFQAMVERQSGYLIKVLEVTEEKSIHPQNLISFVKILVWKGSLLSATLHNKME